MPRMRPVNPEVNGHFSKNRILGPDGRPYVDPMAGGPEEGLALPHVYQFSGMIGGAWRTYIHDRWDEAMRRGREEALSMRRDAFLMGLMQERSLGVASLRWHIEVDNDRDPQQKAIKDGLTAIVKAIPRF